MRGKRSKAYRKLMHQYAVTFNFREPYQVILDSEIIKDAARFKMDLIGGLERTLQGTVKPMITQCDMRHLYNSEPKDENLINQAKQYERRRCNHHGLEHPLSTLECLSEVVDSKKTLTNKHRYVIASQDYGVRSHMRKIPGVPLVYINRSVMILEPMASSTEIQRNREEKAKFKAGLKGGRGLNIGEKRKREDDNTDDVGGESNINATEGPSTNGASQPQKRKRAKGPKAPNPLSMKKKKKPLPSSAAKNDAPTPAEKSHEDGNEANSLPTNSAGADPSGGDVDGEGTVKPKRKRKHKPKSGSDSTAQVEIETGVS